MILINIDKKIYLARGIFVVKAHCVKSVRIRSFSGPHFPAFGLNTERYSVSPYLSVFSPNAEKYGSEKLRIRTLFTQWQGPHFVPADLLLILGRCLPLSLAQKKKTESN